MYCNKSSCIQSVMYYEISVDKIVGLEDYGNGYAEQTKWQQANMVSISRVQLKFLTMYILYY